MYNDIIQKKFKTFSEAIRYRAKNDITGTIIRSPYIDGKTYWTLYWENKKSKWYK